MRLRWRAIRALTSGHAIRSGGVSDGPRPWIDSADGVGNATATARAAVPVPQAPPAHVRRGGRPGAGRAHAAQRGRAGQGAPRLPVRGLARHREDLDGEDPRGVSELRARPDDRALRECESCVSIARANSLDVIEMDAASNNSVDDIRELRESVAYAPVSGRRKVYILDEAHMLSTAAWNAFLKTLEEPPPNTVFVLATTEAQKVPATVVDRCHRFDFHRPTVEQIASVLRRTAEAESIEIPRRRLPRWPARRRAASGTHWGRSSNWLPTAARRSCSRTYLRCSASPTHAFSKRRSTRSRLPTPAGRSDARLLRRAGARRGRVRLGPRGARTRAARGAEPR